MSLKHDAFWFCVSFAFVAGLSVGGFVGAISKTEQPYVPTYKIVIEHVQAPVITEADLTQQAIYPVRQGKRSEPGKLSPEMERTLHAQAIWEIFKSGRDPFERLK